MFPGRGYLPNFPFILFCIVCTEQPAFFFLWHALVSEGLWNSQSKFHLLSCSKETCAVPCFLKVKFVVKVNNGGFIGCQRVGRWPLNKDYITSEHCCQEGDRHLWRDCVLRHVLPHRSRGVAEGKNNV